MNIKMGKEVKRHIKEASVQISYKEHFGLEINDLLTSFYYLKHQKPELSDSSSNMETTWFIHLLYNDIIIRLCKFRDKDNRSWSFNQAHKKLRKRSTSNISANDLADKIQSYRKATVNIDNHRNIYIAHRSKRDREHLKPPDLLSLIRMAVGIVDDLSEPRPSYRLLDIDLRVEVLGEETEDQIEEPAV